MNDLINRRLAIEALSYGNEFEFMGMTLIDKDEAERNITAVPSGCTDTEIQKMQDLEQAQFDEIERLTMESIVRCKDCKHQRKIYHKDARRKDGGYYLCGCDLTDGYSHVCLDDDFCSKAERRENHEAD